jgi:hypothetical protein
MDIILDLNSPSKINKIAELAADMMARGGKLTLSIQMSDHAVSAVMGPYFEWAGVRVGQPEAEPAPVASQSMQPFAQPEAEPAPRVTPEPAVQSPAPSSASGLLDSNGTPYNPDIHAALTGRTGGKNEAGAWKMKRGVDRAVYESWRATKSVSGQPAVAAAAVQPAPVAATPAAVASPFPTGNPFGSPAQPEPEVYDPGEAAITAKAHDLSMRGILTPTVVSALQAEFECDTNAFLKNPTMRGRIWARLAELENSYAG